MKVSVIIPAYNAQETIKALLDVLLDQDLSKNEFEIIVVDDGSTDKTGFRVKKYPVVYFKQKNKGAGAARNLGAKKAKGEILVFVDSDCLVPDNWLKNHYQKQQNKDFSIIGGGVKKPKEGNYLAWTDYFSSWHNAHEDLEKHKPEYVPSLNLSVKKKDFEKIGGFWEKKLTGEDVDFCFRARKTGVKILFIPSLAVWHQTPTLKGWLKHHFNWGYHAPFVRGREPGLALHWLFRGGFFKALALFLPIGLGWSVFLALSWWRYQPLRFVFCSPLIFLGRLTYGFGFLVGSWEKSFGRRNDC